MMFLRDFLYVDSDKVRGLLAQLDEGIVEGETERGHNEKLSGAGLKGLAEHSQRWGTEKTIQKSMGDALFPALEGALESLGLMYDASADLADPDNWGDALQERFPPGTIIRISAEAALFDARYVAATMAAFATTFQGLGNVGALPQSGTPQLKKGGQGGQLPKQRREPVAEARNLEDAIPNIDVSFQGDSVSRELLQGIVQLSRGMFAPGLHLYMRPAGADTHVVTARLQEGRQFLDGDSEVLFSRYGAEAQTWTLVGAIGHYGKTSEGPGDGSDLVDPSGNVNRGAFMSYVNTFMSFIGTLGFVDVPAAPGFSVVPLAVYRTIGGTP